MSSKHLPATNVEGSKIRRRQRSTYDPEATHAPPSNQPKGEEKSNRESVRLEIPANPTKQSPAPRSNREVAALLHRRIRPVFVSEGRLRPPATAAFWPSARVQDSRKPGTNRSRTQNLSDTEVLGPQAPKIETHAPQIPTQRRKKAKGAPSIFVAIKNEPDLLFPASYKRF